jgi:hypothetical protein
MGVTPVTNVRVRGAARIDKTTAAPLESVQRTDQVRSERRSGRLVGPALKAALSNIDRLLAIIINTDDDVEAQNRVMLSQHCRRTHTDPCRESKCGTESVRRELLRTVNFSWAKRYSCSAQRVRWPYTDRI